MVVSIFLIVSILGIFVILSFICWGENAKRITSLQNPMVQRTFILKLSDCMFSSFVLLKTYSVVDRTSAVLSGSVRKKTYQESNSFLSSKRNKRLKKRNSLLSILTPRHIPQISLWNISHQQRWSSEMDLGVRTCFQQNCLKSRLSQIFYGHDIL